MVKLFSSVMLLAVISALACNQKGKKKDPLIQDSKTLADSLEHQVMDGHNVAMAKYGKLKARQNETRQMIDSIKNLPAQDREKLALLQSELGKLSEDLQAAQSAMDKWMDEFNMDSAVNNLDLRIQYLTDENKKVMMVKEAVLNSLQKADSMLKPGIRY